MKRLSRVGLSAVTIGLSLFTVGATFTVWSRQPARGTIRQSQADTDVKGSSNTQEHLETALFSSLISSSLKMKTKNEVASPSILGQYLLADKDSYSSDQLAITVGVSLSGNVHEISPVQFRRTRPNEYIETPLAQGYPEGSISFVKEAEFEKSVFWIDSGKYVAVVVSGGIQNRGDLEESVRVVVQNWRWK